jgi:hypothetical protein
METSGSPSPAPSPLLLLHGELYRAWGVFSKPSQKDRLRREKGHAERRSSSLGAIGAKVNRIEVRPEYIRIHGLAFEEYLIEAVTD